MPTMPAPAMPARPAEHRPSLFLAEAPGGRTAHIVDLENLIGNPQADRETVAAALRAYLKTAGYRPGDSVWVGVNPGLGVTVASDPPVPMCIRTRSGPDGAETILLETVDLRALTEQYARVVIGSGDHAFAPLAASLAAAGTPVVVVARPGSLSGELRGRGYGIRLLPAGEDRIALAA